jgi:hypothetical protein
MLKNITLCAFSPQQAPFSRIFHYIYIVTTHSEALTTELRLLNLTTIRHLGKRRKDVTRPQRLGNLASLARILTNTQLNVLYKERFSWG